VVPTHMPMIRADRNDQVFRTAAEKYKAIIATSRIAMSATSRAGWNDLDRKFGAASRECCRRTNCRISPEREAART